MIPNLGRPNPYVTWEEQQGLMDSYRQYLLEHPTPPPASRSDLFLPYGYGPQWDVPVSSPQATSVPNGFWSAFNKNKAPALPVQATPVDWSKVPQQMQGSVGVGAPQSALYVPPMGVGVNNPNEPAPMATQYNTNALRIKPQSSGAVAKPKTFRDLAREQIDTKMGEGYFDSFRQRLGMDPVDFYSDERNWFKFQRDAAMDFGKESPQFAQATIRAVIEEGMLHQQEIAEWQKMHGNVPPPPEQWEKWYYMNRSGQAGYSSGAGHNAWGVY